MRNRRLTRVRIRLMPETIQIEVPRRGIGSDLTEALAAHGLRAEIVEDGESCLLRVTLADDERERLLAGAIHAIESYLSDRMLPLVVQRATAASSSGRPRTRRDRRRPGQKPPSLQHRQSTATDRSTPSSRARRHAAGGRVRIGEVADFCC